MSTVNGRTYPLDCPDDPRFSAGLLVDVREVLKRHGYPAPTGVDAVELHLALFRFLYDTGAAAEQTVRDGRRAA